MINEKKITAVLIMISTIFFAGSTLFALMSQNESSEATEYLINNIYKGQEALDSLIKGVTASPEFIKELQIRIHHVEDDVKKNRDEYKIHKKSSSNYYFSSLTFFMLGIVFSFLSILTVIMPKKLGKKSF